MSVPLQHGRYAVIDAVDYPFHLVDGQWSIIAARPIPGETWHRRPTGSWVRQVAEGDVEKIVRVRHSGKCRAVAVQVGSRPLGGYEVTSNDVEAAVAVGMSQSDRTFARAAVAVDDPDLVFHEERTEVPFPA